MRAGASCEVSAGAPCRRKSRKSRKSHAAPPSDDLSGHGLPGVADATCLMQGLSPAHSAAPALSRRDATAPMIDALPRKPQVHPFSGCATDKQIKCSAPCSRQAFFGQPARAGVHGGRCAGKGAVARREDGPARGSFTGLPNPGAPGRPPRGQGPALRSVAPYRNGNNSRPVSTRIPFQQPVDTRSPITPQRFPDAAMRACHAARRRLDPPRCAGRAPTAR